jgi:DNA polymerase
LATCELDYETASDVNLLTAGLDRYSADPSTRVLMAAYAFDGGKVEHWQARDGPMPVELVEALEDPDVIKMAFNAQFERVTTNRVAGIPSPVRGWRCTMVNSYLMSFSGGLDAVGSAMGIPADKTKDKEGKRLIRQFSMPQKPTKANPHVWRDWTTDPEDWETFCQYNIQDVIAERAIRIRLAPYPVPERELVEVYEMDQTINDRGKPVDLTFVRNAITMSARRKAELTEQMSELTGLVNPGSVQQLLPWLQERGYRFGDLRKDTVTKELAEGTLTDECKAVLRLRQWQARTSVKKYDAILASVGADSRMRFLFQMAGAGRTGRWAGRKVQTQNLSGRPAGFDNDALLDELTRIVRVGDYEALKLFMMEPMAGLVGTVRSAFRVEDGLEFVVADLKSIESAVIAWLANCPRLLEIFRSGKDPYMDFASVFFRVLYEAVEKWMRKFCKPPTLGCGFRLGGGESKLDKRTGLWGYAEAMGVNMTREDAHKAVKLWRETYPEIPAMWVAQERAILQCMRTGEPVQCGHLRFERRKPFLLMWLPTGRPIFYYEPQMQKRIISTGRLVRKMTAAGVYYDEVETYEKYVLTHMGLDAKHRWVRIDSHGGKTTENAVQAAARDVLVSGMLRAHNDSFYLVGHVHDEAITTHRRGGNYFTLERLINHLSAPVQGMPGLPLGAAGWTGSYYRKD